MNAAASRVAHACGALGRGLARRLALAAGAIALLAGPVFGQEVQSATAHLFWRIGCPHCERAIEFLQRAQATEPRLAVKQYEISRDRRNLDAYIRAVEYFRIENPGVPLVVVGERAFAGYYDEGSTGAAIMQAVGECLQRTCPDRGAGFFSAGVSQEPAAARPAGLPQVVRLPLVGEISTATLSLPVLTIVLAAIDGFNPCAMWTLVFLIGILVGLQDRLRMWALGSAFIVASAAVYYLFMAAWLNLLLFLGMVAWIRTVVGVVALAGAGYYLREFFVNPEAACKVTGAESRRWMMERLKSLALESGFWIALAGIVGLAVAVNLVELICSAGIPAVYTQVLAMSALSPWQYHAYLALYILVFLLDDLAIFIIAMSALQLAGVTGVYARWSHLVGAVVLLAIGLMLILRPEWLVFG